MYAQSKYLNPRNDVAFKMLFGTEDHKDLLISFLNGVLELDGQREIKAGTGLSEAEINQIKSALE